MDRMIAIVDRRRFLGGAGASLLATGAANASALSLASEAAWLGWPALLSLVLIASLTGVAGGLWLRMRQRMPEDGYIPFGPFLALAGLWVMAFGHLPWMPF